MSHEWTDLAFQERSTGSTAIFVFMLSVVFVFLVLAAQYESWALPLAIVLIVPMSVFSALSGVLLRGMDNNILTQIGLVVLVGLAAKNAILIVEFARDLEAQGKSAIEAAIEAARLRLRPILMTSLAFVLGVLPLAIASGAGSGSENAVGRGVVGGMLSATFLAPFLIPMFFVVITEKLFKLKTASSPALSLQTVVGTDSGVTK
jgi:HAE1 family hydrophobic/amphiphilic exporter-1